MNIPAEYFPLIILLDELQLQCQLAQLAIERLRKSADAWKHQIPGEGKPLDIVADCIVCLSAAASIYRLLEPGKREGKKHMVTAKRAKALRRVLYYPPIVQIKKQGTRNSWEHIDERLDEVFVNDTYRSFAPVHVATIPPRPETFVHHHFDPVAFSIKHGEDTLELEALAEECRLLEDAILHAHLPLAQGEDGPYPPPQDSAAG